MCVKVIVCYISVVFLDTVYRYYHTLLLFNMNLGQAGRLHLRAPDQNL